MSKLREAAQAVVDKHNPRTNMSDWWDAIDLLRAALALPETTAKPVAWAVVCDGDIVKTCLTEAAANLIAENLREQNRERDFDWRVTPLYAHPPRDEWRPASEGPKDSKPHAYLLEKLAMVMPLFQEARDALTVISEQQRVARGISPTLADRMDAAGTYSVDDWRDAWRPASEPPEDAMFSRGAVAAIVAGAIYDFAGFMTTRPVSVSIGASDACGPVVDLITSFAEKRGLDLEEAAVQSWNLCIGRDVQPPTEVAK